MKKLTTFQENLTLSNPVDLIEETISLQEWPYYRATPEEILVEISGRWGEYQLNFVWQPEIKILQLYCILDVKISPSHIKIIYELLALLNERLPLGHFEISQEDATPTYRHNLLLNNIRYLSSADLEELIDITLLEVERSYPAFQFVIGGKKSAREAAAIVMLETMGEA